MKQHNSMKIGISWQYKNSFCLSFAKWTHGTSMYPEYPEQTGFRPGSSTIIGMQYCSSKISSLIVLLFSFLLLLFSIQLIGWRSGWQWNETVCQIRPSSLKHFAINTNLCIWRIKIDYRHGLSTLKMYYKALQILNLLSLRSMADIVYS